MQGTIDRLKEVFRSVLGAKEEPSIGVHQDENKRFSEVLEYVLEESELNRIAVIEKTGIHKTVKAALEVRP